MSAPPQSALQAEAEARLRFEMLLADVCAQFVKVAPRDVDSEIQNAQRVICESLNVDHCTVWQVSEENPALFVMTHVYRDPSLKTSIDFINRQRRHDFPLWHSPPLVAV